MGRFLQDLLVKLPTIIPRYLHQNLWLLHLYKNQNPIFYRLCQLWLHLFFALGALEFMAYMLGLIWDIERQKGELTKHSWSVKQLLQSWK